LNVHCEKKFYFDTFDLLQTKISSFLSQNMLYQNVRPYVTHIPTLRVVICRFCEICIPPKDPLRHYKDNHTAKKLNYVPMETRLQVEAFMRTLNLCEPHDVITPHDRVPGLKILEEGFKCNFAGCDTCGTSEHSLRTHYYSHQKHIPKDFKNWESTALQTFFDGHHRK
jgi:hypothetical protein